MGSYSSPSYANINDKAILDPTVLAGTLMMSEKCTRFNMLAGSSALFDGDYSLQVQNRDNSWSEIQNGFQGPGFVRTGSDALNANINGDMKFPYEVRILCKTQATLGVCTLYLIADPPP